MRRSLTGREVILLGLLLVITVVSGYSRFFYMPMIDDRDRFIEEKALYEEQIALEVTRLEEQRRMKKELEEIFKKNPNPTSLAQFDNIKEVMVELNSILQSARTYNLTFGTVNTDMDVVRRNVSLVFTADSYAKAKQIMQKLDDSDYRCMIDGLSVAFQNSEKNRDAGVSVNATLLYFEYQPGGAKSKEPAAEAAPAS